jgi:hypothetical protein
VEPSEPVTPAAQRDLVRRGYDTISVAYRSDDGEPAGSTSENVSRYAGWVEELASLLPGRAVVVDLGSGAGLPATRELTERRLRVLGVDFSAVQLGPASGASRRSGAGRHDRVAPPAGHCGRGAIDTYVGADMFWDHGDTGSYLLWLAATRLEPVWHRYIPEGNSGHSLILARAR